MSGSTYERELVNLLDNSGFAVIRAPSSGSRTSRDLPDVLYGKRGEEPVAVELKTTSENVAYFDESEVDALARFADAFGAQARLCVRWKGDTSFYETVAAAARRTDSGTYAVDDGTDVIRVHEP